MVTPGASMGAEETTPHAGGSARSSFAALASAARTGSLICMITLVLFCLVNVALLPWAGPGDQIENTLAADAARRARADAALSRYGIDFYRRLYPGRSDPEIKRLLYEHSVLRTVYEPFVEFRMPAISYDTLNNHAVGFRILGKDQGPWPPVPDSFNVFVFGGSTTWGGGNLDDETIPAYLQEALRGLAGSAKIALYNFGAGAHFSTQEVTFLQNLLRAGHRPDLVVFIDGLNDFHFWSGESAVEPNLREAVARPSHSGLRTSVRALLMALPVTRVLGTWWANLMSRDGAGKVAVDMLRMSGAQADESEDDAIYRSRYRDAAEISDPARIERVIG